MVFKILTLIFIFTYINLVIGLSFSNWNTQIGPIRYPMITTDNRGFKNINLSNQNLSDIIGIGEMLIYLGYTSKKLKDISEAIILNLSNNNLSSLIGLDELTKLEIRGIYASNNQLISLDGLPTLLNLEFLELNNNHIASLFTHSKFPNLQRLYLDTNNISSMAALQALPKLISLDISNNELMALDYYNIRSSQELNTFKANNNRIKYLSAVFEHFYYLYEREEARAKFYPKQYIYKKQIFYLILEDNTNLELEDDIIKNFIIYRQSQAAKNYYKRCCFISLLFKSCNITLNEEAYNYRKKLSNLIKEKIITLPKITKKN